MMAISQVVKRAGHEFGVAASIDGDAGYGTAMSPLMRRQTQTNLTLFQAVYHSAKLTQPSRIV